MGRRRGAACTCTEAWIRACAGGMSVNGRQARAIRCSICINIYSASVWRVLRNGSQTSFIPTCLPVPWSRYAGFPREDVPLVLRTGLPFHLQTIRHPPPATVFAHPSPRPSLSLSLTVLSTHLAARVLRKGLNIYSTPTRSIPPP